jgi:hypothetical protein
MTTAEALDAPVPVEGSRPRRRLRGGDLWWALPGALIGAVVIWVAHRGLIDDAYITLSYVEHLTDHLHWGLNPTEESNTATSPLNVMLLTAATWLVSLVTGDVRPVLGLGVLTVVLSAAMSLWAAQTARRLGVSPAWSLAVVVFVFADPFVNSALGLEVLPVAALLTGLLAQAVQGRRVGFGVLAGLVVLTRLDLGVLVACVYLVTPALRRRFWVAPLVAAVLALPWYVFSWLHFGSAIPSTFVIKTLQRSFGETTFANGLWQLWQGGGTRLALALTLVPAALGLLTVPVLLGAALRRRLPADSWPLVGLGLGGAAYYGTYCLLQVPPYHWYYAPPTVALGLTGLFGLALVTRPARVPGAVRLGAPVLVAVVVTALAVVSFGGRAVPWTHPVIFGNWALPEDYLAIGADVGELVGDATVQAPPEIGTVAYACDCSIEDVFADPGITLPLIQQRIGEAGPVLRLVLRANFAHLDRHERPRPAEYRLVWTQGPVPPGVRSWPTHSPATGPATVYLERIP